MSRLNSVIEKKKRNKKDRLVVKLHPGVGRRGVGDSNIKVTGVIVVPLGVKIRCLVLPKMTAVRKIC